MSDKRPSLPQGYRGQSAGLAPPGTPRKDSTEFNKLIRSLEEQWQLGLTVRHEDSSPHNSTNQLSDKVYGQLEQHYYKGKFHEVVGHFSLQARVPSDLDTKAARISRLTLLNETIKELESDRSGSPAGSARHGFNASLYPLETNHSSPSGLRQDTPAHGLWHSSRSDDGERPYATAPDPGSPTDEDEPPPSPISSSRSAQRRAEASPRLLGVTKKRPFDSSDSGNFSKLTRTSKGKQPSENTSTTVISNSLSKKPSLSSFRSHQAERSFNTVLSSQQTQSDMNRSFQTTTANTSFSDVMPSSQEIQSGTPDTSARISFSSEYSAAIEPFRKGLEGFGSRTRSSSTTLGSLDDDDLAAINDAVEDQIRRESAMSEDLIRSSQEHPNGSGSTYGSVDEDSMLERSFSIETEEAYTSPRGHLPHSESATSNHSPAKGFQFPHKPSAERSPFNQPKEQDENARLFRPQDRAAALSSPSKLVPKSPETSFSKSPSKVPHYIRAIPEQNLFTKRLPEDLKRFPYFILFNCSRLANEHHLPLSKLLHGVDASSARTDSNSFLEQVCANLDLPNNALRDQQKYWTANKKDFEGFTFKARIDVNDPDTRYSSTNVFSLNILPPQVGRSCRLQRKFKSDRFLYVHVPSFRSNETPRFTKENREQVEIYWKQWYAREHEFLGRKWRAFHIEPVDRKKSKKKKKGNSSAFDTSDKRIVMFATEGLDIDEPISIGNMLNWFFSFKDNLDQPFCKAFARFDLGLSQTTPTLTFLPSQVRYVKDIISDGTFEDTRYDDTNITTWPERYPQKAVMDDGCALISAGAAVQIWQIIRKTTRSDEPMPSAFQGRIGGAKGVWIVSDEPSSIHPADYDIWIQISDSQLKFKPHAEDRSDSAAYDRHRLTFDHLDHSRSPNSANLHISYIPILIDRGVPLDIITSHTVSQLDVEREELIQLLPKVDRLYHWIHREGYSNPGPDGPPWQAAMYASLPEQIKHLLESGFLPEQEPYLADCLLRFIRKRQEWMEAKLQIPLSRSTYVIGVADPIGVLEPGEIQMNFSTPFIDELTGIRFTSLKNMDILVSRQPACRRSDIQKVRAVQRLELSHLIDVVVFPSKGQFPLAGKLQGGDYDGDKFWLCWDQDIVKHFRNAPAPVDPLDPIQHGIQKDDRKLSIIMDPNDLGTVDNLLREALDFRIAPTLLGRVTNLAEKVAYVENRAFSKTSNKLHDMHDLLVDAPKNGYTFTEKDFRMLVCDFLNGKEPREPAYKQAMSDCADSNDKKEKSDADQREKEYNHNRKNALDFLYFDVVRAHDVATMKKVKEFLCKEFGDDPDPTLMYPYLQQRENRSEAVQDELNILLKKLKTIERQWLDITNSKGKKLSWFVDTVEICYSAYCSIQPENKDHPDIKPWIQPYQRPQYSAWEEIRAAAFYAEFPKRHKLVWYLTGKILAELKAASCKGSTAVVPRIKAIMKPRMPKKPRPEHDEESEDDEIAQEVWTGTPVPPRFFHPTAFSGREGAVGASQLMRDGASVDYPKLPKLDRSK